MDELLLLGKKKKFLTTLLDNYQLLLLPVARLCLLAMFIDDGIRVALQWEDQHRFIAVYWWGLPHWWPAYLLIGFSALGQLLPSAMILFRRALVPSCCCLVGMVAYHTVLYGVHLDMHFLAINVAIIGGLFLLLSETQNQDNARQPSAVAGVPQPEPPKDKRAKSMLLLSGRILLPLMFVSLLRWEPAAPMRMLELCVGSALMLLVMIGFHARLAATALALWLCVLNVTLNAWWRFPAGHPYIEFSKFDFFQTLSVIGGLLLLLVQGPGQISVDAYNKKHW